MGLANGFGPNLWHFEIHQVRGDEDTCLDGRSGGDNSHRKIGRTNLLQGTHISSIQHGGVPHALGPFLDEGGVFVDGKHVSAEFVEFARGGSAKAA